LSNSSWFGRCWFTAKDKETGWEGLTFDNDPGDTTFIDYCIVEYAKTDVTGGAFMIYRHDNMYISITATSNIMIAINASLFASELCKMINQLGSGKILWGSDWTVTPNIKEVLKFIKNFKTPLFMKIAMNMKSIKKKDITNILGDNALKILKQ
jgi:predicted TIM-barrel fold metal-dependent hydrolase